ncbi:serine hydrolase domain-containing protein [Nakamurella sp.]|uniref:serine hydrolase domain-containing protein n=1 Tax=Nakamurella sp. TaxID=1869182 RepID=UPI00378482F7
MMQGFPPPPVERWTPEGWQLGPTNRWTFSHLREVVRTARVPAAPSSARSFEAGKPLDPGMTVTLPDGTVGTLDALLDQTFTDGLLVLHRGRIVMERYPAELTAADTHALLSVSKSLIGCVVGILMDQGVIEEQANITTYLPEFVGLGYDGATVRQVLDMRSGIKYSEHYEDPGAEITMVGQVVDWSPRLLVDLPTSLYDYLTLLIAAGAHGGPFHYRSCETDVLGWICERASGRRMPHLLSELIWQPIGAEQDADAAVDRAGTVIHDGGLAAGLRDLGRFGQMLLDRGRVGDRQVVPEAFLEDTYRGGTDSRAAFGSTSTDTRMPGGMYRNQFWLPYPADRQVLLCMGIYGQMIYIDPARDFVAVKLSSWPTAQQPELLGATLAAVDAIGDQLTT